MRPIVVSEGSVCVFADLTVEAETPMDNRVLSRSAEMPLSSAGSSSRRTGSGSRATPAGRPPGALCEGVVMLTL